MPEFWDWFITGQQPNSASSSRIPSGSRELLDMLACCFAQLRDNQVLGRLSWLEGNLIASITYSEGIISFSLGNQNKPHTIYEIPSCFLFFATFPPIISINNLKGEHSKFWLLTGGSRVWAPGVLAIGAFMAGEFFIFIIIFFLAVELHPPSDMNALPEIKSH